MVKLSRETLSPEQRIAAVLRYARFAGPTGDIGQLLAEIERGRDVVKPMADS